MVALSDALDMPAAVTRLFWDVDWDTLNLEAHQGFIIERVLNMGDEVALKWLWQKFGRGAILKTVTVSSKLTLKTARCWQNYFQLKEEQMKCFSTFSASPDSIF
ncbi:MAG: DUF6922 domain-containing protein [Dethiobacteria bacterium]